MRNGINDIEVSSFKNNNDNNNVNEDKWILKTLNTERIAKDLVKAFSGDTAEPDKDKSWRYYCDVAGKLPENIIRNNLELALSKAKTNPGGYFNRLCSISIYKLSR